MQESLKGLKDPLVGCSVEIPKEPERNIFRECRIPIKTLSDEYIWLPSDISNNFEHFMMSKLRSLHPLARHLYDKSLAKLYRYLSLRYGYKFCWEHFDKDAVMHFIGSWYIDLVSPTPVRCKIFLNCLKNFFIWLKSENIATIYDDYKSVYSSFISSLPLSIEISNLLTEQFNFKTNQLSKFYLLVFMLDGPMIFINHKWLKLNIYDMCSHWFDCAFWLHGVVLPGDEKFCNLIKFDKLYPVILSKNYI